VRTWLAIPALALACAAIAVANGATPAVAAAVGALGAALAAAVRAFAGASIAATVAAATGALLGALAFLDLPAESIRAALAGACGLFAIAELARPAPVAASPWPAFGAAVVAAALDPSYVALPAIAGARLVTGPWSRPRWAIALPIAGALAVVLAVVAARSLPELWAAWSDAPAATRGSLAALAGDTLGPLAIVAAVCGLAGCAAASRFAAAAVAAVALGAALVSTRDAALAPALPVAAALACGVAVARLAALVRLPVGQTFVGAITGFLLLVSSAPLASWR
jgi:hypothetical protein